jgi:hypothetical protein
VAAALGLGLLCAFVLRLAHERPVVGPPARATLLSLPLRTRRPFDAALHEAMHQWLEALGAADQERSAAETWDAAAAHGIDPDDWRVQFMTADRSGHLRQARIAAQRAAALAAAPEETYQATLLLAAIEDGSGDYVAELRHARRLMALAPRRQASLLRLRHAARCSGLEALALEADKALAALHSTPQSLWPRPMQPGFVGRGQP